MHVVKLSNSLDMCVPVRLCCLTSMWHPNKRQWWIVSVAVILGVAGAYLGGRYGSLYATIAMLIGGLLLWQAGIDSK